MMQQQFYLQAGINKDGFQLEMSFANPENLPLMPDNFWQQLLELNRFVNFTIADNEVFSNEDEAQYPALNNNKTSNLFHLMQKLIVFPMLHDRSIDLGNMSLTWPFEKYSITEVEAKGAMAFERMCSLNKFLKTVYPSA